MNLHNVMKKVITKLEKKSAPPKRRDFASISDDRRRKREQAYRDKIEEGMKKRIR